MPAPHRRAHRPRCGAGRWQQSAGRGFECRQGPPVSRARRRSSRSTRQPPREDREHVDAQRSSRMRSRRISCRFGAPELAHSNNPAGTSTTMQPASRLTTNLNGTRFRPPSRADHSPGWPGPRQLSRAGSVDFDDLATDQIVDEKCFRVFERNSHKQGATKLVGRLTGVNTLEFDQVRP